MKRGTRSLQTLIEPLAKAGSFEGFHQADAALVFSVLFQQSPGLYLWLCVDNHQAEEVAENLRFFLPKIYQDRILIIPGSEGDPYRGLSPHPEISTRRALGLWKLLTGYQGFVVTTVVSMATRLPSPADFWSHCLQLEVGNFLPMDHLLVRLRENGYTRQDPVCEVGEYSCRGGIVDIYSPSGHQPFRVEFFADEIESIREFDPATQRSVALIPGCEITSMREIAPDEREIAHWHEMAPHYWCEVDSAEALKEKRQFTENGELFNGFEYLFPLVIENSHSLLDFRPKREDPDLLQVILPNPQDFITEFEQLQLQLQQSYEERRAAGELVLPPEKLCFKKSWLVDWLQEQKVFYLEELSQQAGSVRYFDFRLERRYQGRIRDILADVSDWRRKGEKVVFVMTSRGMAERIVDIFKEYGVEVYLAEEGFAEALSHNISVTQGKPSEGFYAPGLKHHFLTQENVFGKRRFQSTVGKPSWRNISSTSVFDFRHLKPGDHVVHIDHGIGVFRGLKPIGIGADVCEFVELSYRDGAKLYVPIDRLDLIEKHSGAGAAKPQIDRLGGASWDKTKRRIKKSMRRLAEELLKLYASREISKGYAFAPDDELIKEFEEAFEYEETSHQQAAIADVKKDMEMGRPMDRLICGDVGYGKTEVAMRAAFKAVSENKQVAVLAPTTVLALQHHNTFRERFDGFPVKVEMISRLLQRKEQADILQRTDLGLVDILIGTHRLLSGDVKFQDLGLIIVDEEQRFGVAQKERLKQLKTQVDVLALSATPIPRTLNMSVIGLRDLSIIETPPKDRLAIQTVVVKFGRNIIRSAIDLELKRHGQVFFVHNSIDTIHNVARMIQETVPESRVAVVHGQMQERQLEEVMVDFLNYRCDVLVSTTIIENGLDIPRANTLIVDRADRFGLSQLYQLRGRVGRSNRRAYAYLLVSDEEVLTGDARKRLAAIKEFSDLGAGFRIAALDLEIRGAGNLLGGEQHGHISAVGFELYMKLLEQTIRKLKGEEVLEEIQTHIDLGLDIKIPEHYIDDSNLRLWLYKRISAAFNEQAIGNLEEEIVDCFGKYPRSVSNLFEYARLRLRAQQLKILSLDRKGLKVFVKFRDDAPISPQRMINWVQRSGSVFLSPGGVVSLSISSTLPNQIFEILRSLLDEIVVLQ